ncbi:hypothetical protein EUX98_g6421 [Antrodiella citrinella]|uniref:Aquaporin-like protein n=1 Tax=Antrodiella citrinella TaxID=2447956 RepID=A0A4S4MPV7_9APHY|nr:hypothetical protein EUX98_g6421 [Antrodiella citrinella]
MFGLRKHVWWTLQSGHHYFIRSHQEVLALERYIIAQILGCYVACLVVYVQYHRSILKSIHTLDTAGTLDAVMFTPKGPAGIFAFYAPPDSNLGQVLVNEFFCDFIFGVITWAALDPTNILVSPALMPWVFGMTLTLMIWSYAYVGVALNSARDVGGRFAAMTLWGTAASGGSYALLASLTNIPGVILGAIFYEVWFTDTSRVVTSASLAVFAGTKARQKHCEERDSKFGSLTVLNKSYAEGKSNMSRESQVSQDDQSSIAVESRSA